MNPDIKALFDSPLTAELKPLLKEGDRHVMPVRYTGFNQTGAIRTYHFERMGPGQDPEVFNVDTDMALFAKHHVAIQEGPGICLRLLLTALEAAGLVEHPDVHCSLSDRELLAYIASRPVTTPRPGPKRKPRTDSPAQVY